MFILRNQFPLNDKLPATNMPVSIFGQVPRDQREQELEYFLSKQYNTIGLKIQNKLNYIEQQFNPNTTNQANNNQLNSNSFISASTTSLQNKDQNNMNSSNMNFNSSTTNSLQPGNSSTDRKSVV